MQSYDWASWLAEYNRELFAQLDRDPPPSDALRYADVDDTVLRSRWLGYSGATDQQLAHVESHLGVLLPPSYRAFLQVSNGWRQPEQFIPRLWSTNDIAWFHVRHQSTIDIWTSNYVEIISDDEYYVYGDGQDSTSLRVEYLKTALEISQQEYAGMAIYLLNPQVITDAGEWEAWVFAHWLPGANRYPSFWDLMQAERAIANMRA
jgi:SMI1 / KNR4 family (SUKH-1)